MSIQNDQTAMDAVLRTELGARLRAVRQERGRSLQHIAERAGLSRSFLSLLERGRSAASIGTLKRICAVLDVPVWTLLDDDAVDPAGEAAATSGVAIVRGSERKVRRYPGTTTDISLLTPDLHRTFEVSISVLQPGDGYGDEPYTHRGEEFGLVLSGTYEVTVAGTTHVLDEGDSIYFASQLPHRTRALGDVPVTTLWVVTPPS